MSVGQLRLLFIFCHELRQIRSISCDLLRGELPIHDVHWPSAYADGNHVCCFSCGCGVGMFFSLCLCCFLFVVLGFADCRNGGAGYRCRRAKRGLFNLRGAKVCKLFEMSQGFGMISMPLGARTRRGERVGGLYRAKRLLCSAMSSASSK